MLKIFVIFIESRGNVCYINTICKEPNLQWARFNIESQFKKTFVLWEFSRQPNYYFALRHPSLASSAFIPRKSSITCQPCGDDVVFDDRYCISRVYEWMLSWITADHHGIGMKDSFAITNILRIESKYTFKMCQKCISCTNISEFFSKENL